MTVTTEREKSIAFSDPYLSNGLCLVINKKGSGDTIQELDFPENTIIVELGTTEMAYTVKNIKRAKVRSLDFYLQSVFRLKKLAEIFQSDKGQSKAIYLRELGMHKSDSKFKNQINAFLKTFREEGGFKNLADKYFMDQQKLFKEQGIPLVFDISEKK